MSDVMTVSRNRDRAGGMAEAARNPSAFAFAVWAMCSAASAGICAAIGYVLGQLL